MQQHKPLWVHALAVIALFASLWIGWSDFDFHPPREEVQQAIRAFPRQIIQIAFQFVLPVLLARFLILEAMAAIGRRRGG